MTGPRTAIAVGRFYAELAERLVAGAQAALDEAGAPPAEVHAVPGAFELPMAAKLCAESGRYDAVICLGAVIRGETPHFDHVSGEAFKGITQVSLDTELPIAVGIVTADSLDQAINRAGGKSGNKGYEAAVTAIEMANLLRAIS